eukprot:g1343.t1
MIASLLRFRNFSTTAARRPKTLLRRGLSSSSPSFQPESLHQEENHLPRFCAQEHLCLKGPSELHSIEDFGYVPSETPEALTTFAATEPFRLLTEDAVDIVNSELARLKAETTFSAPPFAPCVQRGVAKYSPFINDLWKTPELSSILSAAAGLALKCHPMDYEIAHINVQDNVAEQQRSETENRATSKNEEPEPVFGWHRDSQPFVCIVMLSDIPADAQGGATHVRRKDGSEIALQFPGAGYAYLLQGSLLEHAAMPAMNYFRKTMITSFVPVNPCLRDDTNLGLARQYSPEDILQEYVEYRVRRVEERCRSLLKENFCKKGNKVTCSSSSSSSSLDVDALMTELGSLMKDIKITEDSLKQMP